MLTLVEQWFRVTHSADHFFLSFQLHEVCFFLHLKKTTSSFSLSLCVHQKIKRKKKRKEKSQVELFLSNNVLLSKYLVPVFLITKYYRYLYAWVYHLVCRKIQSLIRYVVNNKIFMADFENESINAFGVRHAFQKCLYISIYYMQRM